MLKLLFKCLFKWIVVKLFSASTDRKHVYTAKCCRVSVLKLHLFSQNQLKTQFDVKINS